MKTIFPIVVIVIATLLSGCSLFRTNSPTADKPAQTSNAPTNNAVDLAGKHARSMSDTLNNPAIVTPDTSLMAKVVAANEVGRFVIVSFPANQAPKLQQSLFLYRGGLKVAEVKVTGPQSENNIVADLVSGDAKVGDSVRSE